MPPRDAFTVTHFITVADIDRSADFYDKVFGGRILSRGDSKGASAGKTTRCGKGLRENHKATSPRREARTT
jgi:predicted enzyme related to lactoylglutathione lyase